jgi:hypothetical protein
MKRLFIRGQHWNASLLLFLLWIVVTGVLIVAYVLAVDRRDLAGFVVIVSLVVGSGLLLLGLFLGQQEEESKRLAAQSVPTAQQIESLGADAVRELLEATAKLIRELGKLSFARFALIAGLVLFLSASFLGWRSIATEDAGAGQTQLERQRERLPDQIGRDRTTEPSGDEEGATGGG